MKRAETKKRSGAGLMLLAGFLILTALGVDWFSRPAVERMTSHNVRVFATRVVNEAMSAELEAGAIEYGELVTITQNGEGKVTSIRSNMVEINRLKTKLTSGILKELEMDENRSISIAAGTLFGSQFFAGRGPDIEVKLTPSGYVSSRLYNEFSSAGINQTLHRVMLEATVEIDAIFPGYIVETVTVTNYCIAETVIVGDIPERYLEFSGSIL